MFSMPIGIADFLLNSVAIGVAEKLFSNDPSSCEEDAGAGNCHTLTTTATGSHEEPRRPSADNQPSEIGASKLPFGNGVHRRAHTAGSEGGHVATVRRAGSGMNSARRKESRPFGLRYSLVAMKP